MNKSVSNMRMAEITMRLSALPGVESELVRGRFESSDMQLLVKCSNGLSLSILPDLDSALLYEIVEFAETGTDKLWDKLTLDGAVAKVAEIAARSTGSVSP